MTLGTLERGLQEQKVAGETVRNVGVGLGLVLIPAAIVGGVVLAGYYFSKNLEGQVDALTDWLNPNTGDANEKIEGLMTAPAEEEGEPSAFGKYLATKAAQKDARESAFLEGAGEGGIESSPKVWAQYKAAHPLVRVMSQDDGTTNSAVYQIAIRATAGRRYNAQFVPIAGQLAALVGMAMPGEYYTSATKAEGFIDDPLIDLLAVRTVLTTYRRRTQLGAFAGNKIEVELNMPWAVAVDDPLSLPHEEQMALGISEAKPQWVEWWITEAKKQGRYGPAVGDNKHQSWWYAIEHMGKDAYTYYDWLNDTGRA